VLRALFGGLSPQSPRGDGTTIQYSITYFARPTSRKPHFES